MDERAITTALMSSSGHVNHPLYRLLQQAVVEADNLRAEVGRLSEQLHQTDIDCQTAHAEWEAAQQECERLRAVVNRIPDVCHECGVTVMLLPEVTDE